MHPRNHKGLNDDMYIVGGRGATAAAAEEVRASHQTLSMAPKKPGLHLVDNWESLVNFRRTMVSFRLPWWLS